MTLATRLTIYNGACAVIGERPLLSATENRPSRQALDDVWDRGGVDTCLAAGLWKFAARGVQWNFDPSIAPAWGYQCAFERPPDWIRWMAVTVDPYMSIPLLQYNDEGEYFFCDLQQLWVKFVSNGPQWGGNMAGWSDSFQRYVEAYFAAEVAIRVTGDVKKLADAEKKREDRLKRAKSTDAMNEASSLLPPGNWRQARHGRRQDRERGNPYSFYG